MSTTGIDVYDRAVHKANAWVRDFMEELGWDNRHRAHEALMCVLHPLRDRLTVKEAVDLGSQLPVLLRGFYYQNWDISVCPEKYRHLEEFLDHVRYHLDQHRIDIHAEVLARAAARVLSKHVSEGEMAAVRKTLPEEIRRLWGPANLRLTGAPWVRLPDWSGSRNKRRPTEEGDER